MAPTVEDVFPEGTPVRVVQTTRRRGEAYTAVTVGVVETWENRPTGSWFTQEKKNKLWLQRLRLRKADGEVTLLVIDDATTIAKLEPAGR